MIYPDYQPPAPPTPKPISITDVYGRAILTHKIPDGWEPTGEFRPPQQGESWLSVDRIAIIDGSFSSPRIILRKLPKRIVFTYVGTRLVSTGDWYQSQDGTMMLLSFFSNRSTEKSEERRCYTRSEE